MQEEMKMGKRGLITLFSFPLSWPHHTVCRILVPCSGIEPVSLQWKCGVLTTGP